MAKVLFGNGVAEMRRSIAGNTFSRNKGGAYARQRVRPINPQTPEQIAARERISLLSKRWGVSLTQPQRDAWTAFAEINTVVDVLGQNLQLSGIQMYIKLNARILVVSGTIIDDAPLNQDVSQIVTATATISLTGGPGLEYTVAFSPTPAVATEELQVFSTPLLSPGISFVKNRIRLIIPDGDTAVSPIDVLADWQARFGPVLIETAKIVTFLRVLNTLNGAVSVPVRTDAFVGP